MNFVFLYKFFNLMPQSSCKWVNLVFFSEALKEEQSIKELIYVEYIWLFTSKIVIQCNRTDVFYCVCFFYCMTQQQQNQTSEMIMIDVILSQG